MPRMSLAFLARAVLIHLPSLSQNLTFPLVSVTLLVSFGSSMLYGYNLAVVNSPAVVRKGQPAWEQGKGSVSLPGRVEGSLPGNPASKCWHFPWAVDHREQSEEKDGMGGTLEPVCLYPPMLVTPGRQELGKAPYNLFGPAPALPVASL